MATKKKKLPVKKTVKKTVKKKKPSPKKKSGKEIQKVARPAKKKLSSKKNKPTGRKRKDNGSVDLECFLSTACAKHLQLGDQCMELQTLRVFRDEFMMKKSDGRALIKDYYQIAPGIVQAIESDRDKQKVYQYIFGEISAACHHISYNKLPEAQKVYEEMVLRLKKKYRNS